MTYSILGWHNFHSRLENGLQIWKLLIPLLAVQNPELGKNSNAVLVTDLLRNISFEEVFIPSLNLEIRKKLKRANSVQKPNANAHGLPTCPQCGSWPALDRPVAKAK